MTPRDDVVAYLGPSLSRDDAIELLPDVTIEAPARRGDLYRARNEGAQVLLLVDGHFCQEDALPVREVIDVARDGALVYGASSIGAMRAAECWPVGVRGVGLIYRLFRTGWLQSDDEVAVATDSDAAFRALSVPLVNIRYALAKAARAGLVHRGQAAEVVERAQRLFYPDRSWRRVLGVADESSRLARFCSAIDLKRADALKLFRVVGATLDREVVRPARRPLEEKRRQPLPEVLRDDTPDFRRGDLCRWLVGSGRWPIDRRPVAFTPLGTWSTAKIDEPAFYDRVWNALAERGELNAELMRLRAIDEATADAARRRLARRAVDRYLAQAEIAARYRCGSWKALSVVAARAGVPWQWIEEAADRLALAKRMKAELVR